MEGETAGVGTKLHVKGSGGNDGSIPGTSGMVATDVSRDGCGSTPKAPRRDVSATGRTLLVPGGLVWALVVMRDDPTCCTLDISWSAAVHRESCGNTGRCYNWCCNGQRAMRASKSGCKKRGS